MTRSIYSNKTTQMLGLAALTATMSWGAVFPALAQDARSHAETLDTGTVIPVKLDTGLNSKDARKGDTFTATLRNDTDAKYYDLPTGTRIEGIVRDVRRQKNNDPGVLDLTFRRIDLPGGKTYPIEGSLIGLDNKSVDRQEDGRLVAKPGHRNDRLTYAGYGAGAGLVVGLLTKHTLEDTVIGGGLGYLFSSLQKGQSQARDVSLKPGQELGVRLDQPVSLANYGTESDYNSYRKRNDDSGHYHKNNNDTGYRYDEKSSGSGINQHIRNNDQANSDNIGVLVGNQNVNFAAGAPPMKSNGILMVPIRPVLDAAHIPFHYDATRREIRADGDGGAVRVTINSAIAVVDGTRRVRLEGPVQQLNGTTYVPMKFFRLVTGRDVSYDAGSQTLSIDVKNSMDKDNNPADNRDNP